MVGFLSGLINVLLAAGVAAGITLLVGGVEREWTPRRTVGAVIGVILAGLSLWAVFAVDKLETTARGVVVSIVASALLFIGANKLFDLAPSRWSLFTTLVGVTTTGGVFVILWGNQAVTNPVVTTLVAIVVGGVAGYLLGLVEDRTQRLAIGLGGGAVVGLLAGFGLREKVFNADGAVVIEVINGRQLLPAIPTLDYGQVILSVLVVSAIGLAVWQLRGQRKDLLPSLIWWATFGFIIGAWVLPDVGFGDRSEAIIATLGVGLGFGAVMALKPVPDRIRRTQLEERSRSVIFIAPALAFIGATLVIPTLRTLFLSFRDTRGQEFVGWENYRRIFTDNRILDLDEWTNIFGSNMFLWGAILALIGLAAATVLGRRTGHRASFTPGTVTPLAIGAFLIAFAIFASLRGTIINNIWWVFTVTLVATSAGLAIAVLADRAKYESVAKSLIFMPMAISFVGAGVIWRFMFLARDVSQDQTGVLNTFWVALGRLSNNSGQRNIVVALLLVIVAGLVYLAARAWRSNEKTIAVGSAVTALPILWLVFELFNGIGGFIERDGKIIADTVLFVQTSPFNNVWLMLVLIWIQTGFTMVIFSAAIKAVPAELIEASKVDGATESQTFWRVVVPQIAPTIGVVVTTLIVLVMKVFDIVKVMTNGNFDTQVIANEMWQRAFTELNFGLGSALAVVLFIAVLPILYINIRRMQEAAT